MRRAIISDIHGNYVALEAALKDIEAQKVDSIACLGDVCGYGPDPIECVDTIRKRCEWVLCGNHDAALFMTVAIGFNKYAKDAIEWQRSVLEPRWYSFPKKRGRWDWLQNLPASRTEGDVLYVHASPRDPMMEYVEEGDFADMGFGPSQKAIEIFEKIQKLSFCGHSHRPGVVTDQYVWMKPHELPEMSWKVAPNQKTLVNIGSVGQPRDENNKASFALYDSESKTVQIRRLEYDIDAAANKIREVGLPEILAARLYQGK